MAWPGVLWGPRGPWLWSADAESRTRKVLPAPLLGRLRASHGTRRLSGRAGKGAMQLSPSEAAGPTPPCPLRPLRRGAAGTRSLPRGSSPTALPLRPGASPAAGAQGAGPRFPTAPPRKPPRPTFSSAGGSPRGGMAGKGGGTAGRAAYPEAGPTENLHGRGRGAEPPPGPRRAPSGGRRRLLPSWAGRGRGGAGPARPVPPSPPAAGGASAAALAPSGREVPAGAASSPRAVRCPS